MMIRRPPSRSVPAAAPRVRPAAPRVRSRSSPGLANNAHVFGRGLLGQALAVDRQHGLGGGITTEAVFFHRASRTALFTDLLQQFPPGWFAGWRTLVARLDLMVRPGPTVPRKFRLAFTDRAAAREGLRQILGWPTGKVLIAHGTPVTEDRQAFLMRAFRWQVRT